MRFSQMTGGEAKNSGAETIPPLSEEAYQARTNELFSHFTKAWSWWERSHNGPKDPDTRQSLRREFARLNSVIEQWFTQIKQEKWSREACQQMIFDAKLKADSTIQAASPDFLDLIDLRAPTELSDKKSKHERARAVVTKTLNGEQLDTRFQKPKVASFDTRTLSNASLEEIRQLEKTAKKSLTKKILKIALLAGAVSAVFYAGIFAGAIRENAELIDPSYVAAATEFEAALLQIENPEIEIQDEAHEPIPVVSELVVVEQPALDSETGEIPTSVPTNSNSGTETTLPAPTETPQTQAESDPFREQLQTIENPVELFFNAEFMLGTLYPDRATRLGLMNMPQDGREYTMRNVNGKSFLVPTDLPEPFWYLADPEFVARNIGAASPEDKEKLLRSPVVTMVILGLDSRPNELDAHNKLFGRADAVIMLQINTQTGNVTLTSFPRDKKVPEMANYTGDVLNRVNISSWGYDDENDQFHRFPEDYTRATFESACGCLVDGMVMADFQSVVAVIDNLFPGGIEINVIQDVNDTNLDWQSEPLHLKAGPQRMDGALALRYMRSRKGNGQGDIGRAGGQREVISAIVRGIGSTTRDRFRNGDPIGALQSGLDILNRGMSTLDQLQTNTQNLEAGQSIDPTSGFIDSFGALTPRVLRSRAEAMIGEIASMATNPRQAAALVTMLGSDQTQAWINSLTASAGNGARSGIESVQLTLDQPWSTLPELFQANNANAPIETRTTNVTTEPSSEPSEYSQATENSHESIPLVWDNSQILLDWLKTHSQHFGSETELSNQEALLVLGYVRSLGSIQPHVDLSKRLDDFKEGVALSKIVMDGAETRNPVTQSYYNNDQAVFNQWSDFTSSVPATSWNLEEFSRWRDQ